MSGVELNDVNMEGIKPSGSANLPVGQYLVRIEETERKAAKDKFENGAPHPDNGKNFYLQLPMLVWGGPNDGHVEFERLNLWNSNDVAVRIAKSTLKSIFIAAGVEGKNSSILHGKWMILEVKPGIKKPEELSKHYAPCPPVMIPIDAPPIRRHGLGTSDAQAVSHAVAAPAQAQPTQVPAAAQPIPAVTTPAGGANDVPSWARK